MARELRSLRRARKRVVLLVGDPITGVGPEGHVYLARVGPMLRNGYFIPLPAQPCQYAPLYLRLADERVTWVRRHRDRNDEEVDAMAVAEGLR